MEALAWLLSLILQPCYAISGNWWIAILLFTIIVKIILIPMSLWCQKNSIVMVQLMPALNRLKVKYYGDRETIGEEQNKLYKEQHYHPMLSLIPLAVQIIILFGLLVWRGFVIGMKAPDKFGSMLAIGLTGQIGLQVAFNVAVVTNTIPNTGISLPFFSYGGTSLVMLLAQMGVVLSVSRSIQAEKA